MRFRIVRVQKLNMNAPMPPRMTGMGDLVASLTEPIARGLDRILGTRWADCQSCAERQIWLNEHLPFKK